MLSSMLLITLSSNLILNIFLAIVLSLLGAAAALACSLIVEGKKDMKLF